MSFRILFPVIFSALLVSTQHAAEPEAFELGEVVITADAETGADTMASRISAGSIRKFERNDLSDALRLSPGVVTNSNGPRNESGVYVRGFDLRQTPVFIDGIPVYVPYDGYVDLARFTTADVAGISVSKGFSSATYGANTLGGAINIVTRKPEKSFEGDLLGGWMQQGGYQSALNVGFRNEHWYLQLGGSFLSVDSYPMSKDFVPTPSENGSLRDNAYRQDWRISAKLGYMPNKTDEYALGYIYQHGEKGNPVYAGTLPAAQQPRRFWQWPEWNKQTIYFIGHTQITKNSYIKERLYFDQFINTLFAYNNANYNTQNPPAGFQSYYDDYTLGGSLEFGTKLTEKNTLKAALHGKFDRHKEHNAGAPYYTFEDTTYSFGLEDTHQFTSRFSTTVGASYDRRSVIEAVDTNNGRPLGGKTFSALNPQIGFFYKLPEHGTFHATIARKSRFPTIKDRYSYRLGAAIPNPDLRPEHAIHYDIGYDGDLTKKLSIHASLFATTVDNTIQRVDNVTPGVFQLQNVGKSRNLGTELGFTYKPYSAIEFGTNYTYLDRKNISQPNVKLIDTPRHSLFSWADIRPVEWLSIIPSAEYNSSRWSLTTGQGVGAYALLNLKIAIRLPGQTTLSFGANNLCDRNYALTEGYYLAGRTLFANVQIKF
ncbi:TonB-dependent receptor plug domain-containing protein [Prosthecobacter sp.]|jgi:iron complex outermembrane receptor protein|uniref:TonB-dependent receptor plug domain-containing protein n=1 Tax=Prosthecobacter sp. TaxID=1965333 RepID=UPI0037C6EB70